MSLKLQESWFKVLLCKGSRKALIVSSFPSVNQCRGILSYKDIPRSPHFPIIGSLPYFVKSGGQKQLHKYVDNLHKKLGPLFIDKMAGNDLLFISDPDANLQVYRAEGPYPEHFLLDAWTLYLEETGQKRGLFFMDGPEWQKNRQILNRLLLHPKSMENYVQQISSVCKDFMNVWKSNPPNDNLEYHLYSWNIECLGEIALGMRLGFLDKLNKTRSKEDLKAAKEDEFIQSIYDTFLESANLYALPAKLAKLLKIGAWKRFYSAVSKSLEFGKKYVQRSIEESISKANDETRRSILYRLLNDEKIDQENASILLVDLFLASADTTSHAAAWALYLLGRNPQVAQKAREEIQTLLSNEEILTLKTLNSLSYLKGIIKETMRMYPIATFLTRKLAKEIPLRGYLVPAQTMVISSLYTMGRDPANFIEPDSFRPERWFKSISNDSDMQMNTWKLNILNKKAYVPWGLGGRSCIGKRIAELELSLLLMEALLAFNWTVDEDIDIVMRMVAVPSKNVKLNLKSTRF